MPAADNAMLQQLEAALPYILGLMVTSVLLDVYLLTRFIVRPARWRHSSQVLKSRSWSWNDAAIVLLGVLGVQIALHLVVTICEYCGIECHRVLTQTPLILGALVVHLPVLIIVALVLNARRLDFRNAFGLRERSVARDAAQGTVLSVAVIAPVMLGSVLGAYLLFRCGLQLEEQGAVAVFRNAAAQPWWIQASMVLLAITIVPAAEELLFRGIALPLLAKRLGMPVAMVLVSLLFAVLHFHISSYVPLFVLSMTFCLAYLLSGSMLVPVVMHGTFNFIMISLIALQGTP